MIFEIFLQHELHYTEKEIRKAVNSQKITYNSAIRLQHTSSNMTSDEIRYTPDNEKFPVTVGQDRSEFNSLWVINPSSEEQNKNYDHYIKCNDVISLQHVTTKKFLQMDTEPSFIGKNYQVSTNEDKNQIGNQNDWRLICVNQNTDSIVQGTTQFKLKNIQTSGNLFATPKYNFNASNCGRRCPIDGHYEVSGVKYENNSIVWKIHSGIFWTNPTDKDVDDKWVYTPDQANEYKKKKSIAGDEL